MSSSLPSFLRLARDAAFKKSSRPLTLVLGNTSADLDSFISAVVFAYFHKRKSNTNDSKIYAPLLNLTDVPSSDLWRLRPEYGTALRLAVHGTSDEAIKETEKSLLQALVTIADIRKDPSSRLHATFAVGPGGEQPASKQDIVLVDHNAPQVPGLGPDDLSQRFNLTGTIDHHVDENNVFAEANPRIVKTGIGSCTSLVVQHLQDERLWPTPSEGGAETDVVVLAKLALASILIDTADLTATGDKISDIDRDAVRFLETHITPSERGWDRTAFYNTIQESKSNKLKLLTMDEIFDSDYKEWTEQPSRTPQPLNIGIASLVKDLPWLIRHAGSAAKLTEAMDSFARKTGRDLSIFCLITKGNGPDDEFRKELVVVAYGEVAGKALEMFEGDAGELHLKEWRDDERFEEALEGIAKSERTEMAYKLWWQGDVSKSRKQVAPLLRRAVKKA